MVSPFPCAKKPGFFERDPLCAGDQRTGDHDPEECRRQHEPKNVVSLSSHAICLGVGLLFQGCAETVLATSHTVLPERSWRIFLGVMPAIAAPQRRPRVVQVGRCDQKLGDIRLQLDVAGTELGAAEAPKTHGAVIDGDFGAA